MRCLQWMWIRRCPKLGRCRPKSSICVIVFIVFAVVLYGLYWNYSDYCSNGESRKMISDLCDLYRDRKIAGNLCSALCDHEEIHFNKCTNYHKGKKVILMTCDSCIQGKISLPVVFKMESDLNERDVLEFKPKGKSERDVNEYLEIIKRVVMNSFQYKFGANLSLQNDILSFAWGQKFDQFLEENQLREGSLYWVASSLWSLTEQYEYLLTRLLQNQSFIPQIYGVCGPAYFVEFTESLGIYEYQLFAGWSQTWEKRAGLALKLMDLVQYLDANLYEVLNLCDIKPDNFGLKQNGQLTLIDIDCALFDSSLKEQFYFTNCTKDADCNFFDCRGLCNTKTQRCYLKRTNNNMQALCEDVFVGYLPQFPTGLLRDPPAEIKLELFNLLHKCSFPATGPDGETFTLRGKAPLEVVASLQHLLKRSIQRH